MRIACSVELGEENRGILEKWSKGRSTAVRLAQRAKIVLLAAEGKQNIQIAQEVGADRRTVSLWRRRFQEQGIDGIQKDAPRGGRKPKERQDVVRRIVKKTTEEKPKNATHWSARTLARELQVNPTLVHRVWRANQLKPHLVKTFKVSNDKHFLEKLHDVVGLYLNPPENALIFSLDEKSQIQALDRTQPGLPLKKGRCGTMTHDYKRHGTTTLFAALELLEGTVIGTCMKRHRHQEWIKFLRLLDTQTAPHLDLHCIVDNYATHKHPKVNRWLQQHPRFHIHFIPTSSSWLNLVERWFREITQKRIRRGSFRSVPELTETIMDYIEKHNQDPKPFVWTAKTQDIVAKISRARAVVDKYKSA